jgi:2-dehydropantoate 2-reductase
VGRGRYSLRYFGHVGEKRLQENQVGDKHNLSVGMEDAALSGSDWRYIKPDDLRRLLRQRYDLIVKSGDAVSTRKPSAQFGKAKGPAPPVLSRTFERNHSAKKHTSSDVAKNITTNQSETPQLCSTTDHVRAGHGAEDNAALASSNIESTQIGLGSDTEVNFVKAPNTPWLDQHENQPSRLEAKGNSSALKDDKNDFQRDAVLTPPYTPWSNEDEKWVERIGSEDNSAHTKSKSEKGSPDSIDQSMPSKDLGQRVGAEFLTKELPLVAVAPTPVHILDTNLYGQYIAQSLASSGTPVTLLMHRPLIMQDWHDEGQSIKLFRGDKIRSTTGYDIESTANFEEERVRGFGENLQHTSKQPDTVIKTLIVATDPGITLAALSKVVHRLRPDSTVCFVMLGMGIVEDVNKIFFPNPVDRPNYVLGTLTHTLQGTGRRFEVAEISPGILSCTKLPRQIETRADGNKFAIRQTDFSWPPTARSLISTLLQAPDLHTETLGHKSWKKKHLDFLSIHAVIDAVSVAFELRAEELLYNYKISQYIRMVLEEVSWILRCLPELKSLDNVDKDFSLSSLTTKLNIAVRKIGNEYTDFCLDVRSGRQKTGLEFTLGYLINRAAELKIPCYVLKALKLQVEGKQSHYSKLAKNYIPFDRTTRSLVDDDVDDGAV